MNLLHLNLIKDIGIKLTDINICHSIWDTSFSEKHQSILLESLFSELSPVGYVCDNVRLELLTLDDSSLKRAAYYLLIKLSPLYGKESNNKKEKKELDLLLGWFMLYLKGKSLVHILDTCLTHHVALEDILPKGKNTTNIQEIAEKSGAPLEFIDHLMRFKDTSVGLGELLFQQIISNASKIDTSDTCRGYHGDIKTGNNCIEVKFLNEQSAAKLCNTLNDVGTKSPDCNRKIVKMIKECLIPKLEQYCECKVETLWEKKFIDKRGYNIFAIKDNKFIEMINNITSLFVRNRSKKFIISMLNKIVIPFLESVYDMVFREYFKFIKSYPKPRFTRKFIECRGLSEIEQCLLLIDLGDFLSNEFLAKVIKYFCELNVSENTNPYLCIVNSDGIIDYFTPDDIKDEKRLVEAVKKTHFRLNLPCTTSASKLSFSFSVCRQLLNQ